MNKPKSSFHQQFFSVHTNTTFKLKSEIAVGQVQSIHNVKGTHQDCVSVNYRMICCALWQ
jgi:hypothetical protein